MNPIRSIGSSVLSHSTKPSIRCPTIARALSVMSQPRFSPGTNEAAAAETVSGLVTPMGLWSLTKDGQALERTFKFKTFGKTWDFMTAVSLQCKLKNHHPEWSNVYNTTFIRWTTHSPKGLSEKDITLASLCDAIAKDFGELEPESGSQSCSLTGLADQVVTSAGTDCCTPKK
ncbi:hypothetical protein VHEMI03457 [[Torrubiella] hemipterigena]|uniref:4a-hydroxytetrahydrobiopterin dehydratase n=1 Tax=[Torrubiella] hemipterigena TaxID=1531966 RepID=A0A0A1TAU9_9HYPO|nr:hypothetical protein VHEMI03457 [[Torrubiella] hemipterigena]